MNDPRHIVTTIRDHALRVVEECDVQLAALSGDCPHIRRRDLSTLGRPGISLCLDCRETLTDA